MLVYMMDTVRGSEDGFVVKRFHRGNTYDIAQSLAVSFIKNGNGLRIPDEDKEPFINGRPNVNQVIVTRGEP